MTPGLRGDWPVNVQETPECLRWQLRSHIMTFPLMAPFRLVGALGYARAASRRSRTQMSNMWFRRLPATPARFRMNR